MIETVSPPSLPNQATNPLFYYRNATSQMQIIRVNQMSPHHFEKVVFPGEQVMFHAIAEATLEIYHGATACLTLIERVPCAHLRVIEKMV